MWQRWRRGQPRSARRARNDFLDQTLNHPWRLPSQQSGKAAPDFLRDLHGAAPTGLRTVSNYLCRACPRCQWAAHVTRAGDLRWDEGGGCGFRTTAKEIRTQEDHPLDGPNLV
ncbi:hypothetical protein GCM10022207_67570 [Streptomyces lannensis]|uniref:Uncharacterized protein n=1 Tax=Streptomyces lannensis TaxID=766498 RepID=A0ABP7L0N2_9ACTN